MHTNHIEKSQIREYCRLGWRLIINHGIVQGACTCARGSSCQSAGKHPRLNNWQNIASCDPEQVDRWLIEYPDSNIGLRLGPDSGVVDVEYDDAEGEATANELLDGIQTPTYRSSRSVHRLFCFPDFAPDKAVVKICGLEIRYGTDSRGAQSVLPPSRHLSGIQYDWLLSPADIGPAPFPQSVVDLLQQTESDIVLKMTDGESLATHPGAGQGSRNDTLCRLAGGWIKHNGINGSLLENAAAFASRCSPPMDVSEVHRIVSALVNKEYGSSPAVVAVEAKPRRLVTTSYSDIDPQTVTWLWQDRIALGKLTILAGVPGLGKTFLCCDLAARVSTGRAHPDGAPCERGKVLILSCEDSPGDTIRPRLDNHEADPAMILNLDGASRDDGETEYISLKEHLPAIDDFFDSEPDLRLLVIDPISAFLGDGVNAYRNADVRAVLGPLCKRAEKYNVSVIGVTHLNKGEARSAINRVMDSVGFVAAARAAWMVAADDDDEDRRLFLPIKNNLAKVSGLAFRIVDSRCVWESDPVFISADDCGQENETPRDEAREWLEGVLRDNPNLPAKHIYSKALGDGISKRTLDRAKKELGVLSRRAGEAWVWASPGQPETELSSDTYIF